jgi:hypothetical protein
MRCVNTMIKQLGVFTSEVTRVAREVGTDTKSRSPHHCSWSLTVYSGGLQPMPRSSLASVN